MLVCGQPGRRPVKPNCVVPDRMCRTFTYFATSGQDLSTFQIDLQLTCVVKVD